MTEMIFVESSNIEAIGYDDDSQALHVRFLSGGHYIYGDVPHETFVHFTNAPSKGSFLNREIKGIYQFTKQ